MAALDFPAAPTVGQLFAAPNGVTYQWNGVLWLMVSTTLHKIVAWGSFAPSTSTLLNGFNMAPMVRIGAGDYTINFSSPLPFEYAPSGSFFSAAGTVFGCGFQNPAPTANSLRFRTYTIAGALSEPERIYISCVAGQ